MSISAGISTAGPGCGILDQISGRAVLGGARRTFPLGKRCRAGAPGRAVRTFPLGGRWPKGPDEGAACGAFPVNGIPQSPPRGGDSPLSQGGQGVRPPRHSEAPKGPWESVFFPGEYGLPRRACGPPRNDESWTGIFVGRDHWARRGPPGRRALRNTHHVGRGTTPPIRGRWPKARGGRGLPLPPCRGAPMCAPRTGGRPHVAAQSLPPSRLSPRHLPRQREAFCGSVSLAPSDEGAVSRKADWGRENGGGLP